MTRLINMLSIYAVHDPENGYCQGMSDLGAVFVAIEADDALAFACFEKLMRTARQNFRHDEMGIKVQLGVIGEIVRNTDRALYAKLEKLGGADCLFVYRMVVVLMRRELPVAEALRLWEMCWAYDDEEGGGVTREMTGTARTISLEDTDDEGNGGFVLRSNMLRSTVEHMDRLLIRDGRGRGVNTRKMSSWRGTPAANGDHDDASLDLHNQKPSFFHQFVASVIKDHRKFILNECNEYDDLMRHFHGVRIDFEATAARARRRHTAFAQGATLIQSLYS